SLRRLAAKFLSFADTLSGTLLRLQRCSGSRGFSFGDSYFLPRLSPLTCGYFPWFCCSLRFSDNIIAIACSRDFTSGPCFDPEWSFPCLNLWSTWLDGIWFSCWLCPVSCFEVCETFVYC